MSNLLAIVRYKEFNTHTTIYIIYSFRKGNPIERSGRKTVNLRNYYIL